MPFDAGGTIALPSPTHPSRIDYPATVRSLRRSISRSPSKFNLVRTASHASDASASSANSNSPSPASPSLRRMASHQFGATSPRDLQAPTSSALLAQPPLATPFRPSVKLSLRSSKSSSRLGASPAKSLYRHRTSPKSPPKRALSVASSTSGNSGPASSQDSDGSGQENTFRARSPVARRSFEKAKSRHSMHLDVSGASLQASNGAHTKVSPLKRSDATMKLDRTSFGSPKAKRRSYGPPSLGTDFSVFDNGATSPTFDIHDEAAREYDWTGSDARNAADALASPTPLVMPRRTGSLRKSTLQQRHSTERTSWGRRHGAHQLSQLSNGNEASTPVKHRPRLSLDHYMPPPQRESPFTSQGPLPNPSAHAVNQPAHQPHPLSRTMTTSSSNSSMPDESPSHFPVQQLTEKPRAPMNWSKSLPLGAVRPTADRDSQCTASVSTPDYKAAKPFLGAFASTGLVSKMNRYPELESIGGGAAVPDTPCKKQVNGFATYPPPPGSNAKGRGRHIRHTFGAPSTPFNSVLYRADAQNTFGEQGNNKADKAGLFRARHARKGSLLSLYSDDGRSPLDNSGDSLMTSDADIPPTPTKHQILSHASGNLDDDITNDSPTTNRHMPAPTSAIGTGSWSRDLDEICKYSALNESRDDGSGEDEVPIEGTSDSPTPVVRDSTPHISVSLPSFSRTRAKRGSFSTPAPLVPMKTIAAVEVSIKRIEFAKTSPVLASPIDRLEFARSTTPRTPHETAAPPDASRLSISNANDGPSFPANSGRKHLFAPATPTTRQEGFSIFADRRAITPTNGLVPQELDASLVNRFAKVEHIGRGEFSEVYKVVELVKPSAPACNGFFSTPVRQTSPSQNIYAVKKLRLPIKGASDRAIRLREVTALEALRGSEHIVQLMASWEEKNNLYIQTEFCEEGTLDSFLAKSGVRGRLDDFRIWKIMFELGQAVQYIHDAGFVHLDLKPANVLITFEGALKVADFGMATSLPADKGPDFEGDREYLAPEIIRGEIDKPADIFSLGLIMLEIAANVKLPENGATWTALRENDFREVPTLTQDADAILRDATGMPLEDTERSCSGPSDGISSIRQPRRSSDIFGLARKSDLLEPPAFMSDPTDPDSLDSVVKWLLTAEKQLRPTISQLLELQGLQWVSSRMRAGATVYEGNWGPADEVLELLSLDTEMTDV